MSVPVLLPPFDLRSRSQQYTERTPDTPGWVHFSTILNDLLIKKDPTRYSDEGRHDDVKWMNFMMGLVLERALELAWLDREMEVRPELIRPGELRCPINEDGSSGIIITPDAFDTGLGRPEEYKLTKMSCRQPITDDKFWKYWTQLMCQCKVAGCLTGVLRVLHINGNYSRDDKDPESGYVIKSWEWTWTQLQIDERWAMIVGHGIRAGLLKVA